MTSLGTRIAAEMQLFSKEFPLIILTSFILGSFASYGSVKRSVKTSVKRSVKTSVNFTWIFPHLPWILREFFSESFQCHFTPGENSRNLRGKIHEKFTRAPGTQSNEFPDHFSHHTDFAHIFVQCHFSVLSRWGGNPCATQDQRWKGRTKS